MAAELNPCHRWESVSPCCQFGIFDLRSFIAALSIFKDPEIDLQARVIIIRG
jgi:hypothetical protein